MSIISRGELIAQRGGKKLYRTVSGKVEQLSAYKKLGIVPEKKVTIRHMYASDTNPAWLAATDYSSSEGEIITSSVRGGKKSYIERYRHITGQRGAYLIDQTAPDGRYFSVLPNTQINEVFVNGHNPHVVSFKSPDGDIVQITRYDAETGASEIITKKNNELVSKVVVDNKR